MTRQLRTLSVPGRRALTSGLVLFACLAAHGCKDDDPVKYTTPRRDAGTRDSGADATADPADAEIDAEEGSAGGAGGAGGSGDGGSSGEAGDGGQNPDGGDAGPDPNVDPCELNDDANTFTTSVPFTDEGRFSITVGKTGFGVAYQGQSQSCGQAGNVRVLPVQATGAFVMPTVALEDCSTIRDMSLLHLADGWQVVWVDNSAGKAELHRMRLVENMTAPVGALRTRLTTNSLFEQRPVLAHVGNEPLLAYIAADNAAGTRRISTSRLGEGATPQDLIPDTAGRKPVALALSQMGDAHAAVAWVDEEGKPGVWLQRTDLNGVAEGEPVLLNDTVSAGMTVDLAMRDQNQGGAVLYSVALGGANHEVRFRRLGPTGELLADEAKIVSQPFQGRDASFARLGGGYAVAYRALPAGPIERHEIRLMFITKEGFLMRDRQGVPISYKIADVAEGGGRTTLRVSTDGQLLIGFVEGGADGERLRLIRKRLDCAL